MTLDLTTAFEAAEQAIDTPHWGYQITNGHVDPLTLRGIVRAAAPVIERQIRDQLAAQIQIWIDAFEVPEEWAEAIDAYQDALKIVRGEADDGR